MTEYIIAYATKGNEREVDAMNAVQNIILSLRKESGGESDVIQAVRKALNYYLGSKTISKQEAMVLMGKLDLWKCTESIQHVHTNKHHQLNIGSNGCKQTGSDFMKVYQEQKDHPEMCLHEYFHFKKSQETWKQKRVIPHYQTGGIYITTPLTREAAKELYKMYEPWQGEIDDTLDFVGIIEQKVKTKGKGKKKVPMRLHMAYNAAKARQEEAYTRPEPVSDSPPKNTAGTMLAMSGEDPEMARQTMNTIILFSRLVASGEERILEEELFETRHDKNWNIQNHPVEDMTVKEVGEWLQHEIEKDAARDGEAHLDLPNHNGELYTWSMLEDDQKAVAYYVFDTLDKWINNSKEYMPARITVAGGGGSGKSVLINVIVTMIRRMFQVNDAVHVFAPTGAASHNIGGQTPHSFFGIGPFSECTMESDSKKHKLMAKLQRCCAMIVDERSMLDARILGLMQSHTNMTARRGEHSGCQEGWGGIPIVMLVGDDFQLPSVSQEQWML